MNLEFFQEFIRRDTGLFRSQIDLCHELMKSSHRSPSHLDTVPDFNRADGRQGQNASFAIVDDMASLFP